MGDGEAGKSEPGNKENQMQLLPAHDFVLMKITAPASSRDIQSKLAEFRSFGGRLPKGKAPSKQTIRFIYKSLSLPLIYPTVLRPKKRTPK